MFQPPTPSHPAPAQAGQQAQQEKQRQDHVNPQAQATAAQQEGILKYSLEQYIGFVGRQAFIHYCGVR